MKFLTIFLRYQRPFQIIVYANFFCLQAKLEQTVQAIFKSKLIQQLLMVVLVIKPYKPDPYHDIFVFVQKRVFNKKHYEMVLKQK